VKWRIYQWRNTPDEMLTETDKLRSCINCGRDTTVLDTHTLKGVCNEDCRYDLWVENLYKKHNPNGEYGEYWNE
jgi:sarcosine oxidase delta subunit